MKPKVSVVVAIYNVANYLEQCIKSIISQTFEDSEIILVDDGSKDDSLEICHRYAMRDKRIKVVHQENAGVSIARNKGIDTANSDWIMFVDGDDWLPQNAIETLFRMASRNEQCDVVVGSYYENTPNKERNAGENVKPGKEICYDLNICRNEILSYTLEEILVPELEEMKVNFSAPWAKLYRKNFLKENNIYYVPKQVRAQDEVFNLYVMQYAKKVYVVNTPVYHYRLQESSICRKIESKKISLDFFYVWINEVKKFFDKYGYAESLPELYDFFIYQRIREIVRICMDGYLSKSYSWIDSKNDIENWLQKDIFRGVPKRKCEYYSFQDVILAALINGRNYRLLCILCYINSAKKMRARR